MSKRDYYEVLGVGRDADDAALTLRAAIEAERAAAAAGRRLGRRAGRRLRHGGLGG